MLDAVALDQPDLRRISSLKLPLAFTRSYVDTYYVSVYLDGRIILAVTTRDYAARTGRLHHSAIPGRSFQGKSVRST
jgi:hypothetical protein